MRCADCRRTQPDVQRVYVEGAALCDKCLRDRFWELGTQIDDLQNEQEEMQIALEKRGVKLYEEKEAV